MMAPIYLLIRVDHEWGEFFVREADPITRTRDGKTYTTHSATWCCNSSFGVFGHHWSSMGAPFADFIQDVDEHYLLGKISRTEVNADLMMKSVKSEIRSLRKRKAIDATEAREAIDKLKELADECSDGGLGDAIYRSSEIGSLPIEWTDLSTTDYPVSAKMFVKKLWPEFVKQIRPGGQDD